MANPNPIPHPFLLNAGTRQEDRFMASLNPSNLRIDDRKLGDLLVYLYEFAGQINFYDLQMGIHDWRGFLGNSLPFQLARLQHLDIEALSRSTQSAIEAVREMPRKDLLVPVFQELFEDHFAFLHELSLRLNASTHSFAPQLDRLIASNLPDPLKRLIALCNCLNQQGLDPGIDLNPLLDNPTWGLDDLDLFAVSANCFADPTQELCDILDMATALSEIQKIAKEVLAQMQAQLLDSDTCLQESLYPLQERQRQKHDPYLGLLFSFLQIFAQFQDHLNQLSTAHLDYFFKTVLGLKTRSAKPDETIIVFELQQHIDQYKLDQGRLLLDGTDDNDADILFAIDDEIVLDKAQVSELKALHLHQVVLGEKRLAEGLYIAPDLTKADGVEEDFQGDGPHSWPTMGGKVSKFFPAVDPESDTPQAQLYPRAQQGFVVASPVLFLQEGERYISIKILSAVLSGAELENLESLFKREGQDGPFEKKAQVGDDRIIERWKERIPAGPEEEDDCFLFHEESVPAGTFFQVKHEENGQPVSGHHLPFSVKLSGEEGWLEVDPRHFGILDMGRCRLDGDTPNGAENRLCIILSLCLPADFPAVTFADSEVLGVDYQTQTPLARVDIRPEFQIVCLPEDGGDDFCCLDNKANPDATAVSLYEFIRGVEICQMDINVKVCGVRNVVVQNDENLQDINSLIYPYGVRPSVSELEETDAASNKDLLGSNFFIGSREIFCKNWQDLQININWKDLPEDMLSTSQANTDYHYYSGYEDFTIRPKFDGVKYANFLFKASLLEEGEWKLEDVIVPGQEATRHVFRSTEPAIGKVEIHDRSDSFQQRLLFDHNDFQNAREKSKELPFEPIEELTVSSREAFLRFTLKDQDFQHRRYPFVLARQMMAFGKFQDDEKLVYSAVYGYEDPDNPDNIITFVNGGDFDPVAGFGQSGPVSFESIKNAIDRIFLISDELVGKITNLKTLIEQEQDESQTVPVPPTAPPTDDDGNSLLNTRQQIEYGLTKDLASEIASLISDSPDTVNAIAAEIGSFLSAEFFTNGTPPTSKIQAGIFTELQSLLNSAAAETEIEAFANTILTEVADALKQSATPNQIFVEIRSRLQSFVKTFYQVTHNDEIAERIAEHLKANSDTSAALSGISENDLKSIISDHLQGLNISYTGTDNANTLANNIANILSGSNSVNSQLRQYVYDQLRALFQANIASNFGQILESKSFDIAQNVANAVSGCLATAGNQTDLQNDLQSAIEANLNLTDLLAKIQEIIDNTIGANSHLLLIDASFLRLVTQSPSAQDCEAIDLIDGNGLFGNSSAKRETRRHYQNILDNASDGGEALAKAIKDAEETTFNIIDSGVTTATNSFVLSLQCYSICDLATILNRLAAQVSSIGNIDEFVIIPNEPYTPIIKDLVLDYTATASSQKSEIELIQLMPFPNSWQRVKIPEEVCAPSARSGVDYPTLLATFREEGSLYIGLQNLQPGSILNLYFQLAEATADSEYDPAQIEWSYISNNQWLPLRDQFQILEDGTEGLTRSGIVKIVIPGDISAENVSLLPPSEEALYWLKAVALRNTAAIAETIAVYTQAVSATASLQEANDLKRLAKPLPAESITDLAQADSAIKSVIQPSETRGGAPPETDDPQAFYVRVSERLRHKGRGVNAFDYERLVLDAFPVIKTAKCITHSLSLPGSAYRQDLHLAPGFVSLAVIPDLDQLKSARSAKPKVPISLLNEIKEFLLSKVSPFVQLKVVNPRYETVHVSVDVQLHPGLNANFYLKELAREIRLFLTPWLSGDQSALCFAHGASQSDLTAFIESRPYVDFISCLNLRHEDDPAEDECSDAFIQVEGQVSPRTARSILIAGEIEVKYFAEIYCERYAPSGNAGTYLS